jgi:hydrogenase expression/formation protein HypC
MCQAVPGRIVAIERAPEAPAQESIGAGAAEATLWRVAQVDFGGVQQTVSLACLPEARLGDRVLVHVGLALCLVQEP